MKPKVLASVIMASVVACSGSSGGSNVPSISSIDFKEVPVPSTYQEITSVKVSPQIIINYDNGKQEVYNLQYMELIKTGDTLGGNVFGQIIDINGNPFAVLAYSKASISYDPDANSIIKAGDRYFLITHFEEPSGMLYLSEIDPLTLKIKSTKPIDFSSVGGTIINCAGSRTPYGTHLGGEEDYNLNSIYADKASPYYVNCDLGDDGYFNGNANGKGNYFCQYVGSVQRYLLDKSVDKNNFYLGSKFNLYNYGYIIEVQVRPDGSTDVAKHYITGKYTPELAIMMPDKKTLYMSDDGSYKGLYKLVLNNPQNSFNKNWCGTLYAAKVFQKDKANGGKFDISWVQLGQACDQDVKAIIDKKPKLSDIFYLADPKNCSTSEGYKLIKEDGKDECIKLRVGQDRSSIFSSDDEVKKAAAFLETRKYAAYLGATIEFEKGEGLTYDPDRNRIYYAITAVRDGMSDNQGDIKLDPNNCGAVYSIQLDSNYNAYYMEGLVIGRPLKPGDPGSDTNACHVDAIANPDNIKYIGRDILLIGEDTYFHLNNMVWAYNLKTGKLKRIATVPTGAEVTGVFEFANIGGKYVVSLNVQHPFVDTFTNASGVPTNQSYNDQNKDKRRGVVGFILGIPAGVFMER